MCGVTGWLLSGLYLKKKFFFQNHLLFLALSHKLFWQTRLYILRMEKIAWDWRIKNATSIFFRELTDFIAMIVFEPKKCWKNSKSIGFLSFCNYIFLQNSSVHIKLDFITKFNWKFICLMKIFLEKFSVKKCKNYTNFKFSH